MSTLTDTLTYNADSALTCSAVSNDAKILAAAGRSLFFVLRIEPNRLVSLYRVKTPTGLVRSNQSTEYNKSIGSNIAGGPSSSVTRTHIDRSSAPRSSLGPTTASSTSSSMTGSGGGGSKSQSIADVAWSCSDYILGTCSSGGDVMLWDTVSDMKQVACFSGHNRSIHCIVFHPNKPTELVTASQDGKLKLFDTRDPSSVAASFTFLNRSVSVSPVRDVTFCPRLPQYLASGQESGVVNLWDIRKSSKPIQLFQAHSCSILSIDWHPNMPATGINLLSTAGSRDHTIKVWDFNTSAGPFTQPCVKSIINASYVNRIRWRPGYQNQLLSCCNQTFDLNPNLWDLRRPYMPYAVYEIHKDLVTSVSWCPREPNHFYTTGRDGLLVRHGIVDGKSKADSLPPVALSVSALGQLSHAVSRDRVDDYLGEPTSIDETNLITQSPYYIAVREQRVNLVGGGGATSAGLPKPASSIGTTKLPTCSSSKLVKCQLGVKHNQAPPMGSPESIGLFLARANSLQYHFQLSAKAPELSQSLSDSLVPDLIVGLAQEYKFTGPSVDSICRHNARVALDRKQPFLVHFWLLLCSIYGSQRLPVLVIDDGESTKPQREPQRLQQQHFNAATNSNANRPANKVSSLPIAEIASNAISSSLSINNTTTTDCSSMDRHKQPKSTTFNKPTVFNLNRLLQDLDLSIPPSSSGMVDSKRRRRRQSADVKLRQKPDVTNQDEVPVSPSDNDDASLAQDAGLTTDGGSNHPRDSTTLDGRPDSTSNRGRPRTVEFESDQKRDVDDNFNTVCKIDPNFFRTTAASLSALQQPSPKTSSSSVPISPAQTGSSLPSSSLHSKQQSIAADRAKSVKRSARFAASATKPSSSTSKSRPLMSSSINDNQWTIKSLQPQPDPRVPPGGSDLDRLSDGPDATPIVVEWLINLVDAGQLQTVCTALLALGPRRLRLSAFIPDSVLTSWLQTYIDLLSQFRLSTVCARIIKQCYSVDGGVTVSYSSPSCQTSADNSADIHNVGDVTFNGFLHDRRSRHLSRSLIRDCSYRKATPDCSSGPGHNHHHSKEDHSDNVADSSHEHPPKSSVEATRASCHHRHQPNEVDNDPTPLSGKVASLSQSQTLLSLRCGKCCKPFGTGGGDDCDESLQPLLGNNRFGWACSRHGTSATAQCALCQLSVRGLAVWCRGCGHGGHLEHWQTWLSQHDECPTGCGHLCKYEQVS